ncbi:hypothetical protein D3C81_2222410 [compost metagenome]
MDDAAVSERVVVIRGELDNQLEVAQCTVEDIELGKQGGALPQVSEFPRGQLDAVVHIRQRGKLLPISQ